MHDVAVAALSVFLVQSLALLAARADTSSVSERPLGARASRPHPAGGRQWTIRRRPTRVFKRARCPRSQGLRPPVASTCLGSRKM